MADYSRYQFLEVAIDDGLATIHMHAFGCESLRGR
jgi:hypothetical protein